MKEYIEERVLSIAEYIIDTKKTVRNAAKQFNVSKSTVHKDMSERLPELCRDSAQKVKGVMEVNKAERHIRGGNATKNKYLKCRADEDN
jgi:putative DeoR family transcriptional regulator, stage III sporulation protein D